jgi:hypothetical protein
LRHDGMMIRKADDAAKAAEGDVAGRWGGFARSSFLANQRRRRRLVVK